MKSTFEDTKKGVLYLAKKVPLLRMYKFFLVKQIHQEKLLNMYIIIKSDKIFKTGIRLMVPDLRNSCIYVLKHICLYEGRDFLLRLTIWF